MGWDLLSRATGREVAPGFMGDVLKSAQADGALWLLVVAFCVAAPDHRGVVRARLSLSRLVGIFLGPAGAIVLSSLVWTALHLQYDWFFFGEVFSIGLLLGYLRYRSQSIWLTIIAARPQQSRRDGADHLAGRDRILNASQAHQRDRDRHGDRGQNRLQRDDLRQQRRIAAHLPRQHIGAR